MKASEFDRLFDDAADIDEAIDWSRTTRPNATPRRVNVDFPQGVVDGLDRQAAHLGVTRQSLIKLWIAKRPEQH